MFDGCDPDRAGGLFPKSTQGRDLGLDFLKPWPHRLKQAFAGLGRRDASGRASEQPQAEPFLESADSVTQSRSRHRELCSRFGEAPFACDREEGTEIIKVVARHS